jgi:Sec-independent protein translocase protein TatA
MFGLGFGELILLAFLGLVLLGPKKMPVVAVQLGKVFREFQKMKDDFIQGMHQAEQTPKQKEEKFPQISEEKKSPDE